MSRIGLKLKVLDGVNKGKVGVVIEVNDDRYDSNGNFQQHYQILKFEDGTTEKFSLYNIGILENISFK